MADTSLIGIGTTVGSLPALVLVTKNMLAALVVMPVTLLPWSRELRRWRQQAMHNEIVKRALEHPEDDYYRRLLADNADTAPPS